MEKRIKIGFIIAFILGCVVTLIPMLPMILSQPPTQGHPASEIRPGTFQAGDYIFPSNVVVSGTFNTGNAKITGDLNTSGNVCFDGEGCRQSWSEVLKGVKYYHIYADADGSKSCLSECKNYCSNGIVADCNLEQWFLWFESSDGSCSGSVIAEIKESTTRSVDLAAGPVTSDCLPLGGGHDSKEMFRRISGLCLCPSAT